VSEARGADSVANVEDDVVTDGQACGHVVETQMVTNPPGHVVIRAGRITADTQSSQESTGRIVQGQAASEHVHAAGLRADATAFPAQRRRFTRLNAEGSDRLRLNDGLDLPSSARFQPPRWIPRDCAADIRCLVRTIRPTLAH
jgi:hypothetical protein